MVSLLPDNTLHDPSSLSIAIIRPGTVVLFAPLGLRGSLGFELCFLHGRAVRDRSLEEAKLQRKDLEIRNIYSRFNQINFFCIKCMK